MIAISAFNGCCPIKVTGLVVTRPCNFPNAIKLPVNVNVPTKTLRVIDISRNKSLWGHALKTQKRLLMLMLHHQNH